MRSFNYYSEPRLEIIKKKTKKQTGKQTGKQNGKQKEHNSPGGYPMS
jgi:hypothetical protein